MGFFKITILRLLFFLLKVFSLHDTVLLLIATGLMFSGLMFTYLFESNNTEFIFFFTGGIALVMVFSILVAPYFYKVLWKLLSKKMINYEFTGIEQIDAESALKTWMQSRKFSIVLDKEEFFNFLIPFYKIEYLRSSPEFTLKLIATPALTSRSRADLVDRYYSAFTSQHIIFEPHREDIFNEILDINLPLDFEWGCERYFNLFSSEKTRKKMIERGLDHLFMKSFLGEEYYKYDAPQLFLFPERTDFHSWFNSSFGRKPLLKKILVEQIVDRNRLTVKWSYFKFLQAHKVIEFNYDLLVSEIKNSLIRSEPCPFDCLHLFLRESNDPRHQQGLDYLKHYYGDYRLLKLIKKIKEPSELNQVLEIIYECLANNHKPHLPKKVRDWKELVDYSKEEQKKAQQNDFSLEQYPIYDWDGKQILNYTIWVPRKNYRLIRGGTEMHNCVGNGEYSRKIVNKNSFVFFLRKGIKTQVCIEIQRDEYYIKSIKGLYNNDMPAHVKEAVEAFILLNK